MAATPVAKDAPPSLSRLFLQGWEARRKIDACELASGSPERAKCLSEGVAALERTTELANEMSLFSDNEDLEEVATTSLKYLLLPALIGDLTLQQTDGDRMDIVKRARVYFVDYLRRCRSYGVTKDDPPPLSLPPQDPAPLEPGPGGRRNGGGSRKSYEQLASDRAAKIQRLREQKELERRTEELPVLLREAVGGDEVGGEGGEGRERWVAMLKLWVYKSQDSIKSVEEEVAILRHMEAMKMGEAPVARKPEGASGLGPAQATPRQPMKPFVITSDMLRGKVFGAGYPSLPSMTVEQFYEQKYGSGEVGAGGGGQGGGRMEDQKKEEEEEEEEEETEESLKKAREHDDFKDENRRGWGNKKNMG